jgi:remodeling and spacing factor 1
VNLINELSGIKDTSLTTSPVIENEDECSINDSSDFKSDINIFDPREYSLEKPIDLKRETDEDKSLDKINIPIVGDVIEESVMIVKGEGSGLECDTGNPDETNTQNETLKNEDVKKPKLWTIETICSSSKEVKEDISVPKTGFFFGDDSVPCFNNVSNGENSQLIKEKFEGSSSKENYEDLTTNNKLNEDLTTDKKLYEDLTTNKKLDEDLTTNKKLDEKFTVNEKLNEEFTVNEKLDEEFTVNKKLDEEVAINKKLNEKFIANKNLVDEHAINEKINEELVVNKTLEVDLEKNIKLNKDLTKNEKMDKVVDSTTMNSIESLDKGCSSKSTEDLSVNKTSKQSVFNIKVHEEEVQITERKANEVFTKSEFTVKDDAHIVNSNIPVLKSSCNDKSITFDETEQNNIVNKYEENEKIECKNNDYQSGIQLTHANSVTNVDVHSVNQEIFGIKSLENRKEETEQQLENDQQLVTKLEDNTDVHIHESPIKTNKQSTSDGSPSDKIEKVVKNCDNVNPIKSLLSTANQCIDINEQNIDTVEQNSSTLDNIEFSNEGNLNVIIDNKISANEFNINDNNKEIVSLEVQSNESNTQITKNVDEDIQTIDDLNTNATYLKHDVNLHTESENSIKSEIECSGENVNSKADDQTLIDNVNLYPTTSKQIDDEQNYKKPNLTLHNISNIIETNKSVDDTIVTKQSINTCNMEINKQEYYQIKNKNNNGASIQEKTESVANITQNIFNNKHSLDKILQKSVEIKDISECPSHKKNFMEEFKLENQPESSNFEVEKDNVCMVKSEKNIKELKTKNLDSTVEKNNSEFIENKNKIVLANPKVQKKNNSTNIASENHKFHDEIPTISMEDKIIPTVGKIKHNSSKRDKTKLISTEHKTDVSYEEEPKNESYKKDNFPPNVSVQKSILAVEMDENNANEIVQGGKFCIIFIIECLNLI